MQTTVVMEQRTLPPAIVKDSLRVVLYVSILLKNSIKLTERKSLAGPN
jgi:hypothetical protein